MVVTVCGVQDGWTRAKRKYLEIGKPFVFDFVGFPKRNVIFRGAMYYFRSRRRRVFVRVCIVCSGIDLPSSCGVTALYSYYINTIIIITPQLKTSLEIILLFHIIHSTGVWFSVDQSTTATRVQPRMLIENSIT